MYSVLTTVSNAVLCTWKLLRVCINHSPPRAHAHTHTHTHMKRVNYVSYVR